MKRHRQRPLAFLLAGVSLAGGAFAIEGYLARLGPVPLRFVPAPAPGSCAVQPPAPAAISNWSFNCDLSLRLPDRAPPPVLVLSTSTGPVEPEKTRPRPAEERPRAERNVVTTELLLDLFRQALPAVTNQIATTPALAPFLPPRFGPVPSSRATYHSP